MANDSMGNLEKLGILVIVILVVVVGVVAITPSGTLFSTEPEPDLLDTASLENGAGRGADGVDESGGFGDARAETGPTDPWPVLSDLPGPDSANSAPLPPPRSGGTEHPVTPPEPVSDPPYTPPLRPVVEPPVAPPAPVVVAPPAPRAREYVVRAGDSLARIAARQSPPMRWTDIYGANPGMNPNMIKPGQVLRLPVVATNAAVDTVRREPGDAPRRSDPAPAPPRNAGTHVVAKGETLSAIAQRRLGKAAYWQRIYEANRDVISDPDQVPAGITLRLPSGAAGTSAGGRGDVVRSGNPAVLPRFADATALGDHDYTVERGDNLSRIAARFLGDADRWREIFDANRDRMSEPSRLLAGMKIRIP